MKFLFDLFCWIKSYYALPDWKRNALYARFACARSPQAVLAETDRRGEPVSLLNQVIIISTFPLGIVLMVMAFPALMPFMLAIAPFFLVAGGLGIWLAWQRGIRVEDRFLALMCLSFGFSALCFGPGLLLRGLHPVVAAAFLYGITLALYLMLCFGAYGVVINFQKSRYAAVSA